MILACSADIGIKGLGFFLALGLVVGAEFVRLGCVEEVPAPATTSTNKTVDTKADEELVVEGPAEAAIEVTVGCGGKDPTAEVATVDDEEIEAVVELEADNTVEAANVVEPVELAVDSLGMKVNVDLIPENEDPENIGVDWTAVDKEEAEKAVVKESEVLESS